jgi:nanoRNase/pAp phosphatase (c-di-AMP/oligoRNAs hydrolase)
MASKRSANSAKPRSLPEQTRKLLAQFAPEDKVLIVISADPDALASALAFKRLLWRRVAGVTIARSNEIRRPDNLTMVRLLNIPTRPLNAVKTSEYTKLVMLDSQPEHSDQFADLQPDVIIDHHPPGEAWKQAAFADLRPRYGATSSIMTEYLQGARIKPSARLATALVFGIKNDTRGFQRPALEEDIVAFKFLFPKANHSVLRKIEFSEMRLKDLQLLRLAIDRARVRKHCMYAYLGRVKSPDNLVQIADFYLKVDVVDACAVSGLYNGKLIIILRNAAPRGNAGKTAEEGFGTLGSAGGHKAMARAEIPVEALEENLDLDDHQAVLRWLMRRVQRTRQRKKKAA